MFTLSKEEVEFLLTNPDSKIAAVAQKLKEAESRGEFIPKPRFQKELEERKALEDRLKAIEEKEKAAAEEKARKDGELDKILAQEREALAAEKAEKEALAKQLEEEKSIADSFRAYRKTVVDAVKKQLGNKWLPEFENFSLESLQKIPGVTLPKIGVDGSKPAIPEGEFYTKDQVEKMSKAEIQANLEKVKKSMEKWSKGN